MLNSSNAFEVAVEEDLLIILGKHGVGRFGHFCSTVWFIEDQGLHAIEAITKELSHFGRVLAVGEDGKQRLVAEEVEPGESFLLLF